MEISEKTLEHFAPNFEEDDDEVIRIDADFAEKLAEKITKKIKQLDISSPKLFVHWNSGTCYLHCYHITLMT